MSSSSNPFPSFIHGLPPPYDIFFGQEEYDVYFNNYSFLGREYYSFDQTTPLVIGSDDRNHQNLSRVEFLSPSKKRVATSKIFTAHGPRERRVRLSINISKKFFLLQDLLGFDKASKTLDWLFTKSKTAIEDLVEEMKHTSYSTLCDICEEAFMEKKKKSITKCTNGYKGKKATQKQKSEFHVDHASRNHKRAEARSRARARTIEKMWIKNINNDEKLQIDLDPQEEVLILISQASSHIQ